MSIPGGDRGSAHNDTDGQGHSGQKTKMSTGQGARSLCWICKSLNYRQRDCPRKSQDKSTVGQQQDGRLHFERKPYQMKACTTVPSRNSDVTVQPGGETRVKSIECDPVAETAHVKRCVAGYPVIYDQCTMDDRGIGCPLVKQQPHAIH